MLATNEECVYLVESMKCDIDTAELYLLSYEKELRQYQDDRRDYMMSRPSGGGGRGNLPGTPTESQALRGIEYDYNHPAYLWLKAVEVVLRNQGEQKNKFVELRREAEACKAITHKTGGRPSWVPYLQCKYAAWLSERFIGREYVLSERTIRTWWRDIVNKVVFVKLKLEENRKNSFRQPKTPA